VHLGLADFIVRAKAATYVGDGTPTEPSRLGSHDLLWEEDGWVYRDSYFGGADFIGQEVIWRDTPEGDLNGGGLLTPVWAMNYYGRITEPELLDAAGAGLIVKQALSAMYQEGRFLGGFGWEDGHGAVYVDMSDGDHRSFTGHETISINGTECYRLDYHGGLIKPS
jgi:hypothetical protein